MKILFFNGAGLIWYDSAWDQITLSFDQAFP